MITPDLENKPKADGTPKFENRPFSESKAAGESQRNPRRWLIPIGSLALVLLVVGLAFWAFPGFREVGNSLVGKKDGATAASKYKQVKAILAMEPFLVNLADTDEIRFVKATFQLGLAEEPDDEDKSAVAIAAMRDSIISLLSSKTAGQILTPEGKDKLREEVKLRVGAISPNIKILDVYIVDFVVQL